MVSAVVVAQTFVGHGPDNQARLPRRPLLVHSFDRIRRQSAAFYGESSREVICRGIKARFASGPMCQLEIERRELN